MVGSEQRVKDWGHAFFTQELMNNTANPCSPAA